jgi:ComF family protein
MVLSLYNQAMRAALQPLVEFLFPPRCPLCGDGLAGQNGLCQACWKGLDIPAAPACHLCQMPLASEAASHDPAALVCAQCVGETPLHQGIAAATIYNDTSRKLVLDLKHGRRVALAPLLGRLVAARLMAMERYDVGRHWIVMPVPLHRWRLWSRGFNQSALLAREIARITGARLMVDGLKRARQTPMLIGMGGAERARVMDGAIALNMRHQAALKGAQVILVDDVLTSGATTNACISALQEAGVKAVVIGCFARVTGAGLP